MVGYMSDLKKKETDSGSVLDHVLRMDLLHAAPTKITYPVLEFPESEKPLRNTPLKASELEGMQ